MGKLDLYLYFGHLKLGAEADVKPLTEYLGMHLHEKPK